MSLSWSEATTHPPLPLPPSAQCRINRLFRKVLRDMNNKAACAEEGPYYIQDLRRWAWECFQFEMAEADAGAAAKAKEVAAAARMEA